MYYFVLTSQSPVTTKPFSQILWSVNGQRRDRDLDPLTHPCMETVRVKETIIRIDKWQNLEYFAAKILHLLVSFSLKKMLQCNEYVSSLPSSSAGPCVFFFFLCLFHISAFD